MKHPLLFEPENHHWSPNHPKTLTRGEKALPLTFTISGFLLFARRLVKRYFHVPNRFCGSCGSICSDYWGKPQAMPCLSTLQ
jgi:hypothetical protein